MPEHPDFWPVRMRMWMLHLKLFVHDQNLIQFESSRYKHPYLSMIPASSCQSMLLLQAHHHKNMRTMWVRKLHWLGLGSCIRKSWLIQVHRLRHWHRRIIWLLLKVEEFNLDMLKQVL
jgi:hypothetical protein